MDTPGRGILKVVSILYIILGGIFALMAVLALFLSATIAAWMSGMLGGLGAIAGGVLFVVLLIPAAVDLTIGILGVKYADDPHKTGYFIVTGYILAVLSLIMLIMGFSVWGLIMFILPVLFIVGGYMNRSAVRRA